MSGPVVIGMSMAEDLLGAWTDVVVRVVGEVVGNTCRCRGSDSVVVFNFT